MSNPSLAFAVGSLGVLLLGVAPGCGTNESGKPGVLLQDGGTGGSSNTDSGPGGASQTPIGRACLKDNDCGGGGLICLTSGSTALAGAGMPNGMCVADCSADSTTCQTLDPNSVCVIYVAKTLSSPRVAYCQEGCLIGTPQSGEIKCHNRQDVSCDDDGSPVPGQGFCNGQCRNDNDCATRRCNLETGLCVDAKDIAGTLPIGSPCDPSLKTPQCRAAACFRLTSNDAGVGPGVCSGFCSLGTVGCGTDPTASTPPAAACLFPYTSASADVGDLGSCWQLCDCSDECKAQGQTCRPLLAADATFLGRAGFCGDAIDSTGKPTTSIPCTSTPDATAPGSPDGGHVKPVSDASTGVKDAGKPAPRMDAGDAH